MAKKLANVGPFFVQVRQLVVGPFFLVESDEGGRLRSDLQIFMSSDDDDNNNNNPPAGNPNFDNIKWSDIDVDDDGAPSGAFGIKFEDLTSKQLRTMCSRLKVKGVKNVKKQEMVDRLVNTHRNWIRYQELGNCKPPRKQIQCPF